MPTPSPVIHYFERNGRIYKKKLSLFLPIVLCLLFVNSCTHAPDPQHTSDSQEQLRDPQRSRDVQGTNKQSDNGTVMSKGIEDLDERLRDAQVTNRQLDNGAVMTNVRFAGSLQPNQDLDCVTMSDVTSELNPPALMLAVKKCLMQEDYVKAWALMVTANGFAYYDLKRLADRSARGAMTVLAMGVFGDLEPQQIEKAQAKAEEIRRDPAQVRAYCAQLTRIGPPTYEPLWAILHGMGVYEEPRNGHYLTNVDTDALWGEVLKKRCTPLSS